MPWIFYSLSSIFFQTIKDLIFKKVFKKNINPLIIVCFFHIFLIPCWAIVLFLIRPEYSYKQILFLLISAAMNGWTSIMYTKAFKRFELSVFLPYLSFTPLFGLIFSFCFGEVQASLIGVLGVLFVVVGGYLMHVDRSKKVVENLRNAFSNKASLFGIGIAFVWGLCLNIDKEVISQMTGLEWIFSFCFLWSIFIVAFLHKKINLKNFIIFCSMDLKAIAFIAMILNFFNIFTSGLALIDAPVAYHSSLKKLGTLVTVGATLFLFKEKNPKKRFAASSMMVLGSIIIILS